jgi:hypothetical protein
MTNMSSTNQNAALSSWTIQSATNSTKALSVSFGVLGVLILWLTNQTSVVTDKEENLKAAFWLGALLIGTAVAIILFLENVVIVVDEKRKQLRVSRRSLTGLRSSIHSFSSIKQIEVASIGQSHRGIITHHLNIVFKNDKRLRTQFWSTRRSETVDLAERLALSTGSSCEPNRHDNPVEIKKFLISGAGAILTYCAWYKFMVGPLCPAMWHGTAPAVIMGISFFILVFAF